jgi:regulator of sigma E protease
MTTILAFLFVLGVLVFVHELGHFLAARRLGVRVLTFSLGFGPRLLNVRRGGTDYCISAIPLGGYVKMAGERPGDAGAEGDGFLARSKWQRFQILIAGPAMNLVLAVVVMAFVFTQASEVPAYEQEAPLIGVVQPDSAAAAAGLQAGDLVLTVHGEPVPTWERFGLAMVSHRGPEVPLTVRRGGQILDLRIDMAARQGFVAGDIGVLPEANPVLLAVSAGSPAERAGLQPGDLVRAVDGTPVPTPDQLQAIIRARPGQTLDFTVVRDGRDIQLTGVPELANGDGRMGFSMSVPMTIVERNVYEAVVLSVQRNIEWSGLIVQAIGGLITGRTSMNELQGPVAISVMSGEAAERGLLPLLTLLAVISLNLGILNLLPVPVLDGGHILIMALEGIARRDFSVAVKEKMLLAGFVVLMVLMVTVVYNDLARLVLRQ